MSNILAYKEITALPEVSTSNLRKLQWSIDWWQLAFAEAKTAANNAWRIQQEAIDNHEPQDEIKLLGDVAMVFDKDAHDAWHIWQNCKRHYLALCN